MASFSLDPLDELTDEQRRKLLEDFAPGPIPTGPMARGVPGFAPLPAPKGLGGGFESESIPARAGIDPDLFARFAAAQQRGSKLDALNALGHGFGADASLIAGTGINTIAREPGRRAQPMAELSARLGAERSLKQMDRQRELDAVNLAKTRAETEKAQASARSTAEEAAREAALASVDSPETEAQRKSTAALLAKNPNVTPELLASLNGLQLRELAKTGTSQINAEVMADYRNRALTQQEENAEAQRKLQLYALAQGWNLANLTLEQRERLAKLEAEEKAKNAAKEATNKVSEREAKLRGEILNLAPVKEYQLAGIGLDKVRNAAKDPTPAGDIALIFGYMKTIDPTSVVRETEFATAQNAAGVPDRIRNLYNNLLSGERLNPQQRKEFISSAESQFQAYEKRTKKLVSGYIDLAAREGLNPENIVLDGLLVDSPPQSETPPGLKSSTNPTRKTPPTSGAKPKAGSPSRKDKRLDPTKTEASRTYDSTGKWMRVNYTDGTYGLGPSDKAGK